MVASDFAFTGRGVLMIKDLERIHDVARDAGAPILVTAGVAERMQRMVADALGDRDNTEMVN